MNWDYVVLSIRVFIKLLLPRGMRLLRRQFKGNVLRRGTRRLCPTQERQVVLYRHVGTNFCFYPIYQDCLPRSVHRVAANYEDRRDILLNQGPYCRTISPIIHQSIFNRVVFVRRRRRQLTNHVVFCLPPVYHRPVRDELIKRGCPVTSTVNVKRCTQERGQGLRPRRNVYRVRPSRQVTLSTGDSNGALQPRRSPIMKVILTGFRFLPIYPRDWHKRPFPIRPCVARNNRILNHLAIRGASRIIPNNVAMQMNLRMLLCAAPRVNFPRLISRFFRRRKDLIVSSLPVSRSNVARIVGQLTSNVHPRDAVLKG